jgi:hypothetical protein
MATPTKQSARRPSFHFLVQPQEPVRRRFSLVATAGAVQSQVPTRPPLRAQPRLHHALKGSPLVLIAVIMVIFNLISAAGVLEESDPSGAMLGGVLNIRTTTSRSKICDGSFTAASAGGGRFAFVENILARRKTAS